MLETQVATEGHSAPTTSSRATQARGLRHRRQALGIPAHPLALSPFRVWVSHATSALAATSARLRLLLTSATPAPDGTSPRPSSSQIEPPPGMIMQSPLRARLPKITAITLAVITAAILIKGVLTPTTPPPVVTASSTPAPTGPGIGHLAPDATVLDLNGKPVKLSSLVGKVLVLNFWYVACAPCQTEMPALEKTYLAQQANGFEVVGIDTADSAADIATFVTRLGVTYPILRDTNLSAVDAYSVTATPTSYVIDKRGVIRDRILGPVKQSSLATEVAALVKESSG